MYLSMKSATRNFTANSNMAYSILRNETKRNQTKYMGEGEKMLINLNTAQDNIDNVFGSNS